jgi:hypothetical protein
MSVSSVPLAKAPTEDLSALSQSGGKKHQDSVLMYCSYFSYGKDP